MVTMTWEVLVPETETDVDVRVVGEEVVITVEEEEVVVELVVEVLEVVDDVVEVEEEVEEEVVEVVVGVDAIGSGRRIVDAER